MRLRDKRWVFPFVSEPRLCVTLFLIGSLFLATVCTAAAQGRKVELADLLARLQPVTTNQARLVAAPTPPARFNRTPEGHVRWLSAPVGHAFAPDAALVAGDAAATARGYLRENGSVFGITSTAVDFIPRRTRDHGARKNVRLQQTYAGVPIFGGEAVVQLNAQGGIESVLSRVQRDTQPLDDGRVAATPRLSAREVATLAQNHFTTQTGEPVSVGPAELQIFAPALLHIPGSLRLVWKLDVATADPLRLHQQVLVDAASGEIVAAFELQCTALNRVIQDKQNTSNAPVTVRVEGGAATGVAPFDNAYLFLGDVYNFYSTQHSRDSYDDAGGQITAILRYCDPTRNCPVANAFASNARNTSALVFGDFWAVDDVVAHEFTHKVTAYESSLIYTNASGAINESLSDVWGEFVDLVNGRATDTAAVKWQMGENLPNGALRSMKDPTLFNCPDRLGSPLYHQPTNTADLGGVHTNSGVNNKLCYLLTDGDTFNGQTVTGMGITQVVKLYYEAQIDLLTSSADWTDLFNALIQAAINLRWSDADQNNLLRACTAVEIATATGDYWADVNSTCPVEQGVEFCTSIVGPYQSVGRGVTNTPPGSVLHIRAGTYNNSFFTGKKLELRAEGGSVLIGTP